MKKLIFQLLLLIYPLLAFGEEDLPTPPSFEKTPLFTFEKFERQPKLPNFVVTKNDQLTHKNRLDWNGKDSLFYAIELAYYEEFEHALSYFNRLNTDTLKHPLLVRIYELTLTKTERFDRLLRRFEWLQENEKSSLELEFRKTIAVARKKILENEINIKEDTLFKLLFDTTYPSKQNDISNFKATILPLTNAMDLALREEVKYTDETDKVLAKAYEEFGDFLAKHFYTSNAYIAYSIAHHYDKRDNLISSKKKGAKNKLDDQNLLYPSFISVFGKIKYNNGKPKHYDFDSIELTIKEHGKYPTLEDLEYKEEKSIDYIPWLDYELIVIFIVLILLLFSIFFLRTKDK